MKVMNDKDSRKVLSSLNVDRLFLLELMQNQYTKPDSTMTIKAIMEMMIECRGDNVLTVSSFAGGLSYISREIQLVQETLRKEIALTYGILDSQRGFSRKRSGAGPQASAPSRSGPPTQYALAPPTAPAPVLPELPPSAQGV